MESFTSKLAVVTGGGSGMGRELVRQLAAQGCSVAACDWHAEAVAEAVAPARADAPPGVRITGHACDVSDEAQVLRFRDELLDEHGSDHVDLVFSNAAIGGAGSFVNDSREEWERTFAVDWWGVYYSARAFLPLLIASGDGVLINTSSVNGLWAALGPGMPNTAYAAAKFAVRGFSEALIEDLRSNAPGVRVVLVMPGHVGTDILVNTRRAHGHPGPEQLGVAWTVPLRIPMTHTDGAYATTPVVVNGVLYVQDLQSNVLAVSLATGRVLWRHAYNSPNGGPDGVNVAQGVVYGATNHAAFALSAATGRQLWIRTLIRNDHEGIDMAPGYNHGTVYVSTVPSNPTLGQYLPDAKGTLWALNAATGSPEWSWDEVQNLWGHAGINSGGGQWYPPSFDGRGNIYSGTGKLPDTVGS